MERDGTRDVLEIKPESGPFLDQAIAFLQQRAVWGDFDPLEARQRIYDAGETYHLHRETSTKEVRKAMEALIANIEGLIPLFQKNSPATDVLMPFIACNLCSQVPEELSLLRTTHCVADTADITKITGIFKHYLAGLCEPDRLLATLAASAREALDSPQIARRHGGQHRVLGPDGFGNWLDTGVKELGAALVRIYTFTADDFAIPAKVPKGGDDGENPRCDIEHFAMLCLQFYAQEFVSAFPQLSTLRPALIDGYWWIDFGGETCRITTPPKKGRKSKKSIKG